MYATMGFFNSSSAFRTYLKSQISNSLFIFWIQYLLKLWIKHNGASSIKVPINDHSQVALFSSLQKELVKPWLPNSELLKTDLKKNSGKSPLFVKPHTNFLLLGFFFLGNATTLAAAHIFKRLICQISQLMVQFQFQIKYMLDHKSCICQTDTWCCSKLRG